ncbi:MAG: DUF4190 domain-containing protein, partial [Blastocatellia bacterium]
MICPHCSNENPPQAQFCAACGKEMTTLIASNPVVAEPVTPPPANYPPPGTGTPPPAAYGSTPGYGPTGFQVQPSSAYYPVAAGQQRRKGPAITSLAIGLISFFTGSFFLIGALTGVILGFVAVVKIKKRPTEYSGTGMAITGIILSVFSIGVGIVVFISFIMVPNLANTTRSANEVTAMERLKTISISEALFHTANGRYGRFRELSREENLGFEPVSNGYRIEVTASDDAFT